LKCPEGIKVSGETVIPPGNLYVNMKIKDEPPQDDTPVSQPYRHTQTHTDTHRHTDTQTQTDGRTDRQTQTQTDTGTKRQTDGRKDRQAGRQACRHTHTHPHTPARTHTTLARSRVIASLLGVYCCARRTLRLISGTTTLSIECVLLL
jgi:hypothetical protein